MERYEILKDIGSGNFGVAKLVKETCSGELYAVKYIERGQKIDEHVEREILNHKSLKHPNIIRFKEVLLTDTHLAIVMEYAAGGELFDRICSAGRFSEDEARFFFHQLISGVSYCHSMVMFSAPAAGLSDLINIPLASMSTVNNKRHVSFYRNLGETDHGLDTLKNDFMQQICHRDLKLENTLLDGSSTPRLKICDFGYSKSSVLHSQPKSTVGTPAYIAPEVLSRKEYDGKIADVWSCGVTLYVMLVGAYPFEDPEDPRNFRKTLTRILSVQYSIPDYVRVSMDCKNLLSRIFIANPEKRITIPEIQKHPWCLKNMPVEFMEGEEPICDTGKEDGLSQTIQEIIAILQEARRGTTETKLEEGSMDLDGDIDSDAEIQDDIDTSGDFVCAL